MKFRQKGDLSGVVIGIIIIVVVVVGLFVVINIANDGETGGTGGDGGVTNNVCNTKCTWFREKNCENNRDIGWCFMTWGCGDGIGAHRCEN